MRQPCEMTACPPAGETCACRLDQLRCGCRGRVVSVMCADPELRRRLLEMGFCNDACVQMIRRAPLGDPIEFKLRGYSLSLRQEQAAQVHIHLEPEAA